MYLFAYIKTMYIIYTIQVWNSTCTLKECIYILNVFIKYANKY